MSDPRVTEQVVVLADYWADQFIDALTVTVSGQVISEVETLRRALAGTFISFLADVMMTVEIDERYAELVPTEDPIVKTTAAL